MIRQDEFSAALMDPSRAVPAGITNPDGRPASKRFDVYRNNVAVSLTEALETAFPVICKLVGNDFFRAMAGVFLRQHPPSNPLMMFYGAEMPDFLATFPPAQSLPYLADVARLELALRESYHAADARVVDPGVFADIPADDLPDLRFGFAPPVRVIKSGFPLYDIWAANMADGSKPGTTAQSVLITRPEFDAIPDPLSPSDAAVVLALMTRETLGTALRHGGAKYDFSALLTLLLQRGALTTLTFEE